MDKVVILAGSLGGMDAFKEVLKKLPNNFTFPVVYIFHQKIKGHAFLKEIQNLTDLKVQEIKHNTPIESGNVYLSPPNKHVLISSRFKFVLSNNPEVNYCRPSIDVSFKSLAYSLKEKAICILLSGSNKDGAKGLSYVLDQGGQVFVQSPETAFSPRMPQSALDFNPALSSFSLDRIASKLMQL